MHVTILQYSINSPLRRYQVKLMYITRLRSSILESIFEKPPRLWILILLRGEKQTFIHPLISISFAVMLFISIRCNGQSRASKKAGWLQAAIYLDGEYDPLDNKDLLNIRSPLSPSPRIASP